MKVAVIGGTGSLGRGLAMRLSEKNRVFIGSRDRSKGGAVAGEISAAAGRLVRGGSTEEAAGFCEAAILAISYTEEPRFFNPLEEPLAGKLVISPIVPLRMHKGQFLYSKPSGSAAEFIATRLARSSIAAALHTVPAPLLLDAGASLDFDVLVAADDRPTYEAASGLVRSIKGLRTLYAGPLTRARDIEGLTPLLLNLAKLNGLRNPSLRVV